VRSAVMIDGAPKRVNMSKARVLIMHVERVGSVTVVAYVVFAAGRVDRERRAHPHGPENNVIKVYTPVVAKPVAVVPKVAETKMEAIAIKTSYRRRTKPHIVIDFGRSVVLVGRADIRRPLPVGNPGPTQEHISKAARLN